MQQICCCCSKQSISATCKRHVDSFVQKATLHGVSEISGAVTWPLRLFWILALCIALGFAAYECSKTVIEYKRSPIAASYAVVETDKLTLPDVVICPLNRFNASYFREIDISDRLAEQIEYSFGKGGSLYIYQQQQMNVLHPNLYKNELDMMLTRLNLTFGEFLDRAFLSCRSFIQYCIRNFQAYDCCANAVSLTNFGGRCFRIPSPVQVIPGYGFGLSIVVNLPIKYYRPAPNTIHINGVLVKLAEKGKGVDYDITFVSKNTHALIPLKATKYNFINSPPKYTCREESNAYSRVNCFDECIFETARAICHCTHIAGGPKGNLRVCTPTEQHDCLYHHTKIDNNLISDCRKKCVSACEYFDYTATVTYASFPSPSIEKFLVPGEDYNNSLILDVYFEKLAYTWIEQYNRITGDTFLAYLGGQLGLWVGGSIITLLQITMFWAKLCARLCCCCCCCKTCNKKNANKKRQPTNSDSLIRKLSSSGCNV